MTRLVTTKVLTSSSRAAASPGPPPRPVDLHHHGDEREQGDEGVEEGQQSDVPECVRRAGLPLGHRRVPVHVGVVHQALGQEHEQVPGRDQGHGRADGLDQRDEGARLQDLAHRHGRGEYEAEDHVPGLVRPREQGPTVHLDCRRTPGGVGPQQCTRCRGSS